LRTAFEPVFEVTFVDPDLSGAVGGLSRSFDDRVQKSTAGAERVIGVRNRSRPGQFLLLGKTIHQSISFTRAPRERWILTPIAREKGEFYF